jgi:hypothetical protein
MNDQKNKRKKKKKKTTNSPSKAFNKPDKLKVDPSSEDDEEEDLLEVELALGEPVELVSLDTPLVKAASRSRF